MSILDEIVKAKHREIALAKERGSALPKKTPIPGKFIAGLKAAHPPAIIAEFKRASPSKGSICEKLGPVEVAESYQEAGAGAMSILTDAEFFRGSLNDLIQVAEALPELPLLRKEFIIDPWQIEESARSGASALLLIAAILPPDALYDLADGALAANLDVLIEIHSEAELGSVAPCLKRLSADHDVQGRIALGVNSRDLRTFQTSIEAMTDLIRLAETALLRDFEKERPLIVAESSLRRGKELALLARAGADAFLIGETFLRAVNPGDELKRFRTEFLEYAQ